VSTADVLALVVAALFLVTGGVKLLGVEASLTIRDHFAMSPRLWQVIGVLECSGAIGTALGIWAKPLGVLALLGLVGLMLGAVVNRLRVDDPARLVAADALTLTLVVLTLAARLAD
jgi:hypothetical protein